MWIQISWLLMKPADLDLHSFQTGYIIWKNDAYSVIIRLNTEIIMNAVAQLVEC